MTDVYRVEQLIEERYGVTVHLHKVEHHPQSPHDHAPGFDVYFGGQSRAEVERSMAVGDRFAMYELLRMGAAESGR